MYMFCWGLIKYSILYFSSNTHVARVAKRNASLKTTKSENFQKSHMTFYGLELLYLT